MLMKRIACFLVAILLLGCSACAPRESYEAAFVEMGIPLEGTYPLGGVERSVWGIEYYNGAIDKGNFEQNGMVLSVKY